MIGLIDSRLRDAGRWVGRAIFRKRPDELPLGRGHSSQVLAEHMSKVEGASMIWCSLDGELLHPIVHGDDRGVEVIGLGCLSCHKFFPTLAGVLTDRAPSGLH
jgi:hypothetical protein